MFEVIHFRSKAISDRRSREDEMRPPSPPHQGAMQHIVDLLSFRRQLFCQDYCYIIQGVPRFEIYISGYDNSILTIEVESFIENVWFLTSSKTLPMYNVTSTILCKKKTPKNWSQKLVLFSSIYGKTF